MFLDGFHNIENIDFAEEAVKRMSSHCESCVQMKWHVMDAKNLQFPDNHFDVVLEKATIDGMLVNEKDPWKVSESGRKTVASVMKEAHRVLRPGGSFISISFSPPHLRGHLLLEPNPGHGCEWRLEQVHEIGDQFHYFYYKILKRAPGDIEESLPIFSYEPPSETRHDPDADADLNPDADPDIGLNNGHDPEMPHICNISTFD
jgi:ubiquinone/menaquinone biosynthesis C-methylase UbiE